MRTKSLLLMSLTCFCYNFLLAQTQENEYFVNQSTAQEAAVKWMSAKGHVRTVDESRSYINTEAGLGEQLTFYVLSFEEGGFAIVPSTKMVIPVLAYNHRFASPKDKVFDGALFLMNSYHDAIMIHLDQNVFMEGALQAWDELLINNTVSCNGQSTPYDSMLEHYQTSRWAGWDSIYDDVTPLHAQITPDQQAWPVSYQIYNKDNGHIKTGGTCVPTALSQICRFFRHPFVGNGSGTHTMANENWYVNQQQDTVGFFCSTGGQVASSDFSVQSFNYDKMPYRLRNQGPADGFANGDPNGWTYLTPPASEVRNAVGYLTWNLGVAARMNWYSDGTYGNVSQWANDMVDHFGYIWDPLTDYVTINQYSTFKNKIRNSLLNERPVLVQGVNAGGGHAYLYTGFECDNYFYGALGMGGNHDGFYYILDVDANGNYQQSAYPNSQQCATNLRPDCNLPFDQTISNTTYANGMVEVEQVNNILTVGSGVTLDSGSDIFLLGGHSVQINPGFQMTLGAKLYVNVENCAGPD